jgi:hypothetical protein
MTSAQTGCILIEHTYHQQLQLLVPQMQQVKVEYYLEVVECWIKTMSPIFIHLWLHPLQLQPHMPIHKWHDCQHIISKKKNSPTIIHVEAHLTWKHQAAYKIRSKNKTNLLKNINSAAIGNCFFLLVWELSHQYKLSFQFHQHEGCKYNVDHCISI